MLGLTEMLTDLGAGRVKELEGQDDDGAKASREQFADLDVLIGYGRRLFDAAAHRPRISSLERPAALVYLDHPAPAFPSLPWDAAARANEGEADICLQLTAGSEAAVRLAAVEVWKHLRASEQPLLVRAAFTGFGRKDGRGWLGFHDGVSNLDSSQRERAIAAPADPAWMEGGTYLAFLKIAVDLDAWATLTPPEQELVIGRDKLSGRPLIAVKRSRAGGVTPVSAPRVSGRSSDAARAELQDPAQTTEPLLEDSHIHRANQNRASASAPAGLRIFRQGYDFLDLFNSEGPRLGLNFVSFQSDLLKLQHILHLPGWLGDVNFGGPADEADRSSTPLLRLVAGGFYASPPNAEPFPGADLLGG